MAGESKIFTMKLKDKCWGLRTFVITKLKVTKKGCLKFKTHTGERYNIEHWISYTMEEN